MVLFLKHVVFNGILDLYQCPILGPVGTFTELLTCSIGLCKIATVSLNTSPSVNLQTNACDHASLV